ncbi:3-keto-5-aminohexanoate cleavage protein [Cupriavidus alkaliphilus]|uniref:3-keto-5-aminohexanoate cleavage protein n=1 Tax=Cupriavidus alkaliphilus TaxID=942866 RepID=UPI000DC2B346|nr:3-keto-5-aminohexanoate cleavage protein [Cupriavidus alkaliphilus]RAS05012.1 3-keto-5-aminohexanoate cleavage enzyme [Cupriavidus alkaliphilus]
MSKFNELLAGIRARVPDMIPHVGGSISLAPENEGDVARWLSDDTRHMLAELKPAPDQVTMASRHTSSLPPSPKLETVERMTRKGTCDVPLILTWVAIGGGFEAPNLYNLANFVRACPNGSVLTLETSMLNVLPLNMMSIAMGLHVRCGIEDNIWTQRRDRAPWSRSSNSCACRASLARDVANGKEARGTRSARFMTARMKRWRRMGSRRIASRGRLGSRGTLAADSQS